MSSYLVLARKYRPRDFGGVMGQEVVTEVLRGALKGGHIGQAYLLAGPRGTGKTTLARIFAKCLNCERGPTSEPCGTCERCLESDASRDVDLIEIDAASHTGVENIRELREEVGYAPMRGRYKVYLVDEVHMLSKAAFNALLKTLEEPPAHVVFLFATTEPHKVLDTILSRCQILRLAPLPEDRIVARLEEVLEAEGVKPGPGVVSELARHARGGMRDALSQTDKLLAFAGNEPTLEDLRRLGGETGTQELEALLDLVERGERAELLQRLQACEGEEQQVLDGLLDMIRSAALLAACGQETPLVSLSGAERKRAAERAQRLGAERLELWMHELLRARERLRLLAGQERVLLELVLLDLARSEHTLPLSELVARLEALEGRLAVGAPAPAEPPSGRTPARPGAVAPAAAPERELRPAERSAAVRSAAPEPEPWALFLGHLERSGAALKGLFERHGPGVLRPTSGAVELAFVGLSEADQRLISDRRNLGACQRAYQKAYGSDLPLRLGEVGAPAPRVEREAQVRDLFTDRVAQHFDGTVEDIG